MIRKFLRILFISIAILSVHQKNFTMDSKQEFVQIKCSICMEEILATDTIRSCENFHTFHKNCLSRQDDENGKTSKCSICNLSLNISNSSTLQNIGNLNLALANAHFAKQNYVIAAIELLNKKTLKIQSSKEFALDKENNQNSGLELFQAINAQNSILVEDILESGADVNISDNTGSTPLFHAIRLNNPVLVKLLLKHGADVIKRNKQGGYPFASAVKRKVCIEIGKLLVEYGKLQAIKEPAKFYDLYFLLEEANYNKFNMIDFVNACLPMSIEEYLFNQMRKLKKRNTVQINSWIEKFNSKSVNPFHIFKGQNFNTSFYLEAIKLHLLEATIAIYEKEKEFLLKNKDSIENIDLSLSNTENKLIKHHFDEIKAIIKTN